MLINFRVTNYKSFRDAQELSLLPTSRRRLPDFETLPVVGIYGANAAGKSNLLESLKQLRNIGEPASRLDRFQPHQPFDLDHNSRNRPTTFEFEVETEGVRYEYGLVAQSHGIEHEYLFSTGDTGRRKTLLRRSADNIGFGASVSNRTTLNQFAKELPATATALSLADSYRAEELQPFRRWLSEGLIWMTPGASRAEESLALAFERRPELAELAKVADLGIDSIRLEEAPGASPELIDRLISRIDELQRQIDSTVNLEDARSIQMIKARRERELDRELKPRFELSFYHNGSQRPFSVRRESRGTVAFLRYMANILDVLERGSTLIVDEFDTSLHPRLIPRLLELFKDKRTNPRNAQLICTTHDATLLGNAYGGPILSRDEVWFVEKGSDGASELFPLTAFQPREQHNIERGYIGGVYGAVPEVQPDSLVLAVLTANERNRERAGTDEETSSTAERAAGR